MIASRGLRPVIANAGLRPVIASPGLRPAVFIDKDGTLIEDVPWNVDPERLRFVPAALESLQVLAAAGWPLLLVTNQSGIGLGQFTRAQFARLQDALERRLMDEAGIALLDVLICPHVPGADGTPACLCRKPAPGMLLRAARRHRLDLARSWMVGDILDDVEAGHRAGCRAILLDRGGETVWRRSPLRRPDAVCNDWDEIVPWIVGPAQSSIADDDALAFEPPDPHGRARAALPLV